MIALSLCKASQKEGRVLLLTKQRTSAPSLRLNKPAGYKDRIFGKLPGDPTWYELDAHGGLVTRYPDHKGTGAIVQSLLEAFELGRRQAAKEALETVQQGVNQMNQARTAIERAAAAGAMKSKLASLADPTLQADGTLAPPPPAPQPGSTTLDDLGKLGAMMPDIGLPDPSAQQAGGGFLPDDGDTGGDDDGEDPWGDGPPQLGPAMPGNDAPQGAAQAVPVAINKPEVQADMDAFEAELAELEGHFNSARSAAGGRL